MINVLFVPGGASTIGAVDALKDNDRYNLVAADLDQYAPGLLRDEVTGYTVPPVSKETEYIDRLVEIIRIEDIDVLIPGCDRDVVAVSRHMDRLVRTVNLVLPDREVVETAYDALSSVSVARDSGVRVPATYESVDALEERQTDPDFPKFVKPRTAEGGKGARKVRSWEELEHFYEKILQEFGDPVIQDYVPGETGSMHVVGLLYNRDGELRCSFTSHSLRTAFSWGGGGVVGEPTDRDDLVDLATAIVDQLGGWIGPINMEFKIHAETGEPVFIEINPRLWGYNYIATANGMNFPKKLVEIANGNDVEPQFDHANDTILVMDSVEQFFEQGEDE